MFPLGLPLFLPIPSEIRRIYGVRKWYDIFQFMHVNVQYIENIAVKITNKIYITGVKFLLICLMLHTIKVGIGAFHL